MIPKECKRLAEVDFPIAAVSKHSAREKSIRHGHPSTLHLWWARRPLAACRSMLMALLLPDPCDPACPPQFIHDARRTLLAFPGAPQRWHDALAGKKEEGKSEKEKTPGDGSSLLPFSFELLRSMRSIVLEFIADFANWDNAAKPAYLNTARALVKAAHGEEPPLVVDPFAGGGSIPLEALRIGCDAFASDLNPVACLINKVLLEDIPRHGPELAEELRRVGAEIKKQAEKELAEFYPPDPDGARPIAYLWARTVRCEQPNCGCEIPLLRSMWLSKKVNRKRALRYEVVRPKGQVPHVEMQVSEPTSENEVQVGTVRQPRATCPACGMVLSADRVRAQLSEQRGGSDAQFDGDGRRIGGARMVAVVTVRPHEQGRHYRSPELRDDNAVRSAHQRIARLLQEWKHEGGKGVRPVPDERINPVRPSPNARGLSAVTRYGIAAFGDAFTSRQLVAMVVLAHLVRSRLAESCRTLLACALSRVAMSGMACTRWNSTAEKMQHTFGRQALPMIWDFAEVVVTADAPGNWRSGYELIADVIEASCSAGTGQSQLADAAEHPLPDQTTPVWFTDPPYYDSIPYADLADFFLVWLRRLLSQNQLPRDPFDSTNVLSPKERESVWNRGHLFQGRVKDKAFYEEAMARAFVEGRRHLSHEGVGSVVFAHKTTEGWEALLSGMIRARWTITGSWPIATEMGSRLNARETASLSTSVHLVCRPREDDAGVGDWGEIIRELPPRVTQWMDRLQEEGVRGADLVFACIGPALEIFSRYSKVETAEGREVPLAEYLEKVWEVVGRSALEQVLQEGKSGKEKGKKNGARGTLEEDARLTALFLWTMQSTEQGESEKEKGKREDQSRDREGADDDEGDDDEDEGSSQKEKVKSKKGFSLIYDVARRFAQPLGIHLEAWENRIIETDKGVVRLLPVLERAEQLFGEEGAGAVADRLERGSGTAAAQLELFPQPRKKAKGKKKKGKGKMEKTPATGRDSELSPFSFELLPFTTLDRVHAAMLLQAGGRANALRALLKAEIDRGPDFLRLANALSALYPQGSDEKRLLDAMLLAAPR